MTSWRCPRSFPRSACSRSEGRRFSGRGVGRGLRHKIDDRGERRDKRRAAVCTAVLLPLGTRPWRYTSWSGCVPPTCSPWGRKQRRTHRAQAAAWVFFIREHQTSPEASGHSWESKEAATSNRATPATGRRAFFAVCAACNEWTRRGRRSTRHQVSFGRSGAEANSKKPRPSVVSEVSRAKSGAPVAGYWTSRGEVAAVLGEERLCRRSDSELLSRVRVERARNCHGAIRLRTGSRGRSARRIARRATIAGADPWSPDRASDRRHTRPRRAPAR